MIPTLFADVRQQLAEGPIWHEDALWWVNITAGTLYRRDGYGKITNWKVGAVLGVALPAQDGWWWTARERDCAWLHTPTGRVVPIAQTVPELPPAHRFNDGFCGPDGHPWVGSMAMDDSRETAALYRADETGALHIVRRGITLSNGLGWSPDGNRFYYVDSQAHTLSVFDYDNTQKTLHDPRVLREVPAIEGFPDGLSIDVEGNIWLAVWGGSAVYHINGQTGDILNQIQLPASQVSSCCSGGINHQTLFVTSAAIGLSEKAAAAQPHAGSIFKVDTNVRGLPETPCSLPPPI